jgi:hypothetical protein
MTLEDYFNILGLTADSSLNDVKKAYRQKARLFHPDLNKSPDAINRFIEVTEAYEFLISYFDKAVDDTESFRQAMEDWRKYRQDRSKQKARTYARASYIRFRKTQLYKTTRIFDGATVLFSMIISITVIAYTIFGYIYRLKHPLPQFGKPSVFIFIVLLLLGILFFSISIIFFNEYRRSSKKRRKTDK